MSKMIGKYLGKFSRKTEDVPVEPISFDIYANSGGTGDGWRYDSPCSEAKAFAIAAFLKKAFPGGRNRIFLIGSEIDGVEPKKVVTKP